MGLNGLVTGTVAAYTRKWRLLGQLKENDTEEFQKGRVPDHVLMLNICIRAALDKMPMLDTFE